jgi:hypothetical protein
VSCLSEAKDLCIPTALVKPKVGFHGSRELLRNDIYRPFPAARDKIAIRVGTPLRTSSTITD